MSTASAATSALSVSKPKRGWAVDEDVIETAAERIEDPLEPQLAVWQCDHFDLSAREVSIRWYQRQVRRRASTAGTSQGHRQ